MNLNNPIMGGKYFLDGFNLLTKPGIKRFVIMPVIINILLFIALLFVLRHYLHTFNIWFEEMVPSWLYWLAYLLWFFCFVGFLLIFIYTFVSISNLLAAPFNGLLAEKVAYYLTGTASPDRGIIANIKDVPRVIGRQLSVLFYYLPRAILLLVLFFIPLVQALVPMIWFVFNAWFMSMTYLDYPSDNDRVSFKSLRLWLHERRWVSLGFGSSVLVASMIPLVNFFALPAAVAGATKFWVQETKRSSLPRQ